MLVKSTQQTYSGKLLDLNNPKIEDINIRDIAHSLSMICRFNGCVDKFYSVAEHSVKAYLLVKQENKLEALLHDAVEAYIGDVTRPLKSLLPEYRAIELKWSKVISQKFGIPIKKSLEIKRIDGILQVTEFLKMMIRPDNLDSIPTPVSFEDADMTIEISNWTPLEAEQYFLECYREISEI
ncbi:MAG: hypothetical protein QQN41_07870 [Nitrosopumilus sp.]